MKWPLEFSEQIEVGDKDSQIAIVTLWTKKEKIIEKLNKNYAIVGQLYSPEEGVNALIRNLLANKKIRDVIVTGADLSGSGNAITTFFKKGIDMNHKIKGMGNITIDEEIPTETLEDLRKNIELYDLREVKDFSQINKVMDDIKDKSSWGEPEIFPKKQIKPPETFPSEKAGFVVHEKYISDAWIRLINLIMTFGKEKKSQYSELQKELIAVTTVIEEENPGEPKLCHCFDFSEKELENYYPQVLSDKRIEGISYTYGQRLRNNKGIDQIKKIIEKLKKTKYTRRAIAFTWDVVTDYDSDKSPCLNIIQAIVQDDKLFLTAYFRSNDIYNAWPKNAFALRKLQKMIADEVKLELGPLIIISNSAHIYKSSWVKAEAIIKHFPVKLKRVGDPRGNLIVRVDGNEIVIVREGPDGSRIGELRAKTAVEMYNKLMESQTVSLLEHAFYLGTELQKAETAIKEKKKYVQDK